MDIFEKQKLRLRFDAVDVSNGANVNDSNVKAMYKAGIEVEVAKIVKDTIWLKFPDGETIAHRALDVIQAYEKVGDGVIITKTTKGSGTPPKALFPMMPEEANWAMNYGWSVTLSLEPLGPKKWICQDCYTELPESQPGDQVQCPNCLGPKIPVSVESILGSNL